MSEISNIFSSYCFKVIVRYPDLKPDEELLFSLHQIKQIKDTIDKAISNFIEEKNIKDIISYCMKSKNWETKMIDIFIWKCYFGGKLNSEETNEQLVWCLSDNRNYFKDKTDSFKKIDSLEVNTRMSEKIIALTEICISKKVSYHLICNIMSFYPLD